MAYEDWGDLSNIQAAQMPPEPPSLLGRFGQRVANAPSDIINSLLQLEHNVGVSDQLRSVPTPYDIPEARTLPEGVVDIGAGLAESIPLFATGEGAGAGLARLAELGPVATRAARLAAGFGLNDLTRSPEQAAAGAATGGLMGVAESVPGIPARIASMLGLAAASYGSGKMAGESDTQAGVESGVNVLLSQLFRARTKRPAIPTAAEPPPALQPMGPQLTYPDMLQGRVIPKPPGYGGELPGRPLALEAGGGGRYPTLEGDFTMEQPRLEGPVAPLQLEGRQPIAAPPPAPVTRQVMPAPEPPKMTLPQLLATLGVPEDARPPEAPRPPIAPRPPERPIPPRAPFPPRAPGELLMTDMEQMRGAGYTEEPPPVAPAVPPTSPEPVVPSPPATTKPQKLMLSDVLTAENSQQAAEKLGVEFKGFWPGTNHVEFRFPPSDRPTDRANFTLNPNATYKDLKNKVKTKRAEFEANPPAEWVAKQRLKGEGSGQAKSFADTSKPLGEGEVATLQPESAAASPPSPLENAPPPPEGMKYGDIVKFKSGDEVIKGKLQPPVEGSYFRIVETDGTEHDMPAAKLSVEKARSQQSIKDSEVLKDVIENLGVGEAGAAKLEQAQNESTFGKKKISNFGQHGFTVPEQLEALSKFIVAPAIGGLAGYASGDENNRTGAALAGALAAGFGGHYLFKLLKMAAHGHDIRMADTTTKTASGSTTVKGKVSAEKVFDWAKSESVEGLKAIFGDEAVARDAAWAGGMANGWQRFARWMNDNFKTDWELTRTFQQADGIVNEQLDNVRNNIKALTSHPIFKADETIRAAVRRFIENGDLSKLDSLVSNKEIKDFAISAKASIKTLATMFGSGLPDGSLKDRVTATLNSYLTQSYRAFETPDKFKPDLEKVIKAAESIKSQFPDMDFNQVLSVTLGYLQDIRAGKQFGRTLEGVSIGSGLTELKHLTPEFRDMLDPIKDPLERILFTAIKLGHAARSAAFFDEVARMEKPNGIKWAYGSKEHSDIVATLQQQAIHGTTEAVRVEARAKLRDVMNYVYQPEDVRAGKLAGQWVDSKLRAQIVDYGTNAQTFSNPIINAIAKGTNLIKYNKIILSPLQFARQVVQLPILGLMSGTGMGDWVEAFKILKEHGDDYHRLQREGVLAGDIIQGMIRKDARFMVTGALDAKLGAKLSTGLHKWEELWRMPDLIVRTSAFLKKERQLTEAAGLSKPTREITNAAIDHMNRYTMNYAAVSPFVRKARQLPFLNQYMSWTAETLRITKNLVEDVRQGNDNAAYAGAVLTGLAAIPTSMAWLSEQTLSEKDRADWNKYKDMGAAYSRYNFRIVMGRLPNGDFRYLDFTPLVIHDQLMRMTKGIAAGDWEAVKASNPVMGWENTPALNIFAILTTQRDRFTGDKLYGTADVASAVWKEAAPTLAGGSEWDRLVRSVTPNAEGGLGIIDQRTGRQSSLADVLVNYATSVRPYTLRPAMYEQAAIHETQDRLRQQQRVMRRAMQTNRTQESKERARQDFIEARTEILKDFRRKLGIQEPPSS